MEGKSVEWKMGSRGWRKVWRKVWRACVNGVMSIYWGMGGVPDGSGFVLRVSFVHWEGVGVMAVIDEAGGYIIGLLRSVRSKVEVRRRILV